MDIIEMLLLEYLDTRNPVIVYDLYILVHYDLYECLKDFSTYGSDKDTDKVYSQRCSMFATYEEKISDMINKRHPKRKNNNQSTNDDVKDTNKPYLLSIRDITDRYREDFLNDREYTYLKTDLKPYNSLGENWN